VNLVQALQGVAAFVLAGGKSVRMGQDKAFVVWEASTLLQRALAVSEAVAAVTCIVGAREKFAAHGRVVEDIFRERGPLGGIHAALSMTDQELNLVLAVDLPFVTPALLAFLIERARGTRDLATVPRLEDGWEPLCAVYRKEFAQVAARALERGQNAIHRLLEDEHSRTGVGDGIRAIEAGELMDAGFAPEMFRNINTVTDLESLP
jgi:molybdopterin-guanine dinucleotide biosynthesis protein A